LPGKGRERLTIWLSTIAVIFMILLFSAMIYGAREREQVDQFNRQQFAIARGAAAGIDDFMEGLERSIAFHARLAPGFPDSGQVDGLRALYEDMGGKTDFVGYGRGSSLKVYPSSFLGKNSEKLKTALIVKRGKPGAAIKFIRGEPGRDGRVRNWIIVSVPVGAEEGRAAGVAFAAVSLSGILKRYIDSSKHDIPCDTWVMDEDGTILSHPDESFIGRDASALEPSDRRRGSLKERILKGGEGEGEYYLAAGKSPEKYVVAFIPIDLQVRRWYLAVGTPRNMAAPHLKKTVYTVMAGTAALIAAALIGSAAIVRSGERRVRLEEELKRLRVKEEWQEKLAREKRTIEGIIEGSPIPTFVIDRDHRIIFWNRACADLTGYAAADMIGTDRQYLPFYPERRPVIADLILDQDFGALERYYGKKEVRKSAVIEGAYEANDYYENLGGRKRYLYFLAAPIRDENAEIIAAIETLQDVTREKQMELDLKRSTGVLRNELNENLILKKTIEGVIEGLPIPAFVIDRNHRIMFWNRACAELTGYGTGEMVGTDRQYLPFYPERRPVIADLIVDRNFDAIEKYYEGKVAKSAVIEGAFEATDFYENLGRKRRHLFFLAAPIHDENKEIIAAIETLQDVTREKQMELDMKQSARILRSELNENLKLKRTIEGIIEGSPIAAFVIDRDHRIMFWNRACAELTGFKTEDMIGTDRHYTPFYRDRRPVIADLILDQDFGALERYYGKKEVRKSAVVEGAYEATDYYEDLGGQKRYLYFLAAPIYDESGRIIAAIETLQDVTREREMERGLKEYAETLKDELYANITLRNEIEELYTFLQSVIESSPDRIFVLNTDGVVTYASRESAPEGESGRGVRDAADVKGKYFWELVDPENRGLVEKKWAEVKSGVFRPFEIDSIDAAGTGKNMLISVTPIRGTDRYISVQRDITEFKSLEKRFYETEKLAAVGQLSAGIAHEVRNPLSSIKMSLQILEKRLNPSGNDLKRFKIAEKEVEHLEKLVNDILLFARPADPVIEPGDINESVKNSLNMAEKEISDKKIEVRLDFAAGLPRPGFDQSMLKQALLNIYLNAIDAMDAGGKLTIVTRTAEGDGPAVEIEIRDTGTGIDEEALPHIFNPFFTTKNYGTGLGLAHVKKIIDLHNGSIEVFSKKGQGVRVILRLPA